MQNLWWNAGSLTTQLTGRTLICLKFTTHGDFTVEAIGGTK
jgi:hypothetical protein